MDRYDFMRFDTRLFHRLPETGNLPMREHETLQDDQERLYFVKKVGSLSIWIDRLILLSDTYRRGCLRFRVTGIASIFWFFVLVRN